MGILSRVIIYMSLFSPGPEPSFVLNIPTEDTVSILTEKSSPSASHLHPKNLCYGLGLIDFDTFISVGFHLIT